MISGKDFRAMHKKVIFDTMPDGTKIEQYTLINKNGVAASFITLGGIWTSMLVPDQDGRLEDVVLGCDKAAHYMKNGSHFGEIVGRNANRIGGARYTLNGKEYVLEANNGPNNLHSGSDYYRNRIWGAEVLEEGDECTVSFSIKSHDGDQGYPGNASITVSYTLTSEDALKIQYAMICDSDTIANMTNHSYFNLAGHNTGSSVSQQVWIDADGYTPMDSVSIPTGEILPVKGTPMDFTTMKAIGQDIDADFEQLKFGSGYDHNWVLNHKEGELSLVAKAFDETSGRNLEVYTDLPGIQFYTANYLDDEVPGKDGAVYGLRHGYCFETQYFPNAVNTPDFTSPILKEGKEYRTTTIYKFSHK